MMKKQKVHRTSLGLVVLSKESNCFIAEAFKLCPTEYLENPLWCSSGEALLFSTGHLSLCPLF